MDHIPLSELPLGYASFSSLYEYARNLALKARSDSTAKEHLARLLSSCGSKCRKEIERQLDIESLQVRSLL